MMKTITFFNWIVFFDEVTFELHGSVNEHNFRYWIDENPHWMRNFHTQYPQKLNVWVVYTQKYNYRTIFLEWERQFGVTFKSQDSLFYGKFKVLDKEERISSLRFLSLSQVMLLRAHATSRTHLCKAPDCKSTSDLRAL